MVIWVIITIFDTWNIVTMISLCDFMPFDCVYLIILLNRQLRFSRGQMFSSAHSLTHSRQSASHWTMHAIQHSRMVNELTIVRFINTMSISLVSLGVRFSSMLSLYRYRNLFIEIPCLPIFRGFFLFSHFVELFPNNDENLRIYSLWYLYIYNMNYHL